MKDITNEQLRKLTLKEATAMISNAVYEATILIESLEYTGKINGNGHHIRQNICAYTVSELEKRWVK